MELTTLDLVIALVVSLVAATAQGVVGIGFGVLSVPILSLVNPNLAPVPQLLVVLPLTLMMAWRERAHLDLHGATWLLLGRFPGLAIGLGLLALATQRSLDVLIAVIVLAGVAIRARHLHVRRTRTTELLVGTFSGTASLVASVGGPPMALLYQDRAAATVRSSLSAVFSVGLLLTITTRAVAGFMTLDDVRVAALLFPAVLIGYFASIPLAKRLDERWVRDGILVLSTIAAIGLLFRAL